MPLIYHLAVIANQCAHWCGNPLADRISKKPGDSHGRFGPASNEYTPISGDYYGVPYRSLIAKGVKNLLLAGRNVSADSTAAGAIRVMPPCMGMGQASGTAAALAVKKGVTPREVDAQELRAVLKANGAHL